MCYDFASMNWLLGRGTAKCSFCAEVFVDVGPVNPVASAGRFPVVSLLLCRVQKSRIPCLRLVSFSLGVDSRVRI